MFVAILLIILFLIDYEEVVPITGDVATRAVYSFPSVAAGFLYLEVNPPVIEQFETERGKY